MLLVNFSLRKRTGILSKTLFCSTIAENVAAIQTTSSGEALILEETITAGSIETTYNGSFIYALKRSVNFTLPDNCSFFKVKLLDTPEGSGSVSSGYSFKLGYLITPSHTTLVVTTMQEFIYNYTTNDIEISITAGANAWAASSTSYGTLTNDVRVQVLCCCEG